MHWGYCWADIGKWSIERTHLSMKLIVSAVHGFICLEMTNGHLGREIHKNK